MTEQQKRQLAQPITDLYADLTDELMTAIAEQLASYGQLTETARWKAKKLLQSGELNQRVMKIIAQRTKICPELILAAVENAAWAAVNEIEPELQEAAKQGLVSDSAIAADAGVMQVLTMYQRQAEQACNLVNTVMLYKARDAYTGIVNHAAELAEKPEYLQILGKRTGAVVTGMQSRRAAVRQCIHEFAEKGLPGFVDKRGRGWSPEAYINMDIRTTVNNTAHETQFARMDAYSSDLIEVSSHIGARPLCAPYQGKLYSRSGKSGYTTDLNGNRIPYEPWSTTSYGQPAGLLGINCGHYVYAFFPGLSTQTYEPYDTEQNAETYKQSQRQRYLERRIRASKRECMMFEKLGDEEGFKKAAVRLKERKAALNHFLNETGRGERADRAQVVGFGRSQAKRAANQAKTVAKRGASGIMESELGAFKKRLRADDRIEKDYYSALKKKFAHGTDAAKALFEKYVPLHSVVNAELEGTAYFNTVTKKISMNYHADLHNERGAGATWFHEHGHLIDDAMGNISRDDNFLKMIQTDALDYRKKYGITNGLKTWDKIDLAVSAELNDMRKHSAVSDIFQGATSGNVVGIAGHRNDYWNDEYNITSEAFAHMFEAQFDKIRYAEMKKYFPNALRYFETTIKEAIL